jgi:hypothetical protein
VDRKHLAEARAMVEKATGKRCAAYGDYRLACELVRSGRIGKVHAVRFGLPGVNFKGPPVPDSEPPARRSGSWAKAWGRSSASTPRPASRTRPPPASWPSPRPA